MLKKLVKHGNSSALILDRSILALLDINENAVLKLRIEGDSLIVKAAEAVKPTDSLMTEIEALHATTTPTAASKAIVEANEERVREWCKKTEQDPAAMDALKEWEPGSENARELQEAYGEIMQKYQAELAALGSEDFQRDVETLAKQFDGDTTSKGFCDEFLVLRLKHAPKLAEMDKEMKETASAMGMPSWMCTGP